MSLKMDLYNEFIERIDKVSDNSKIEKIAKKVKTLNEIFDVHDTKLENFLDGVKQFFTFNPKKHIKNDLKDCFDKFETYDGDDVEKIKETLKEIVKICDEDFWSRISIIFRGS